MSFVDLLGVFALGVLWLNTALIVAHAALELRDLNRRKARLSNARRGRVTEGAPLAETRVVQVGRSRGDGQVHFHDRRHESECFGGRVEADGVCVEVPAAHGAEAVEVWASPAHMQRLSACPSAEVFERTYELACKAKGVERVVRHTIQANDAVWVVPADPRGPLWISGVDPRTWIAQKQGLVWLFMIGSALLLGLCTWLVLRAPVYGTVSTLGAALCLAFFLLVQPAGAALSEAVRPLHVAALRGRWVRPAS